MPARSQGREADRRALEADRAAAVPAPREEPPEPEAPTRLLAALRRRFVDLGWATLEVEGFDLALEGTGLVPPLVLVLACEVLTEEEAERAVPAALRRAEALAGLAPRTLYVVLASPHIPNPVAVQHVAGTHGVTRGWRRLLVLPLNLGRHRLLDGHVPSTARSDNDLRDPLLNLGAVVGASRW